MKRRVVVTGLGTLNPLGNSVEESWQGVREGRCGIDRITQFDTSALPVSLAGEVKNFDPEEVLGRKEARRMDRFTQLAVAAAMEAFEDSGLNMEEEPAERCDVFLSSGIGGLNTIEAEHTKAMEKGAKFISPFFIPMMIANMAAGQIAIKYGFRGMCTCVVTACAGGTNAIGDAFHYLRDGYGDVAMAGGAESCVDEMGVGGFAALKALSTSQDPKRASIPFDAERNGFVLGEGSGVLVLEEYEHARKRGAKIYAEVIGYGANCDAHHMTAPLEDGSGAAKCMMMAMQDADVKPCEIDYINAHGTSTHLNDAGETRAVHAAFGEAADSVMMSSTKSMTGHLLGGSGAVEAIFTVKALQDGFVPATIGYQVPDPECDLNIVPNVGIDAQLSVAMSNSFGFGGHNASLIFAKVEE